MQLHPAEIANELKNFHFFKSFRQDLLLQVSTMTTFKKIARGEMVLCEGEHNTSLFFIRRGSAEVLMGGEVVAVIQSPGEVIGEMSVVTRSVATSSIRATSDLECFVIDSVDFEHVPAKDRDHFQAILFRIYASILVERLDKANQRVRLFEIANRELYEAAKTIQFTGEKKVVFASTDKKQISLARTAIGGSGMEVAVANDLEQFQEILNNGGCELLLCDEQQKEILDWYKGQVPVAPCILMTTKDIRKEVELLKAYPFFKFVITRDLDNRSQAIKTILTALSKVLTKNPFGLDKYLTWGVEVKSLVVKSSKDREKAREEVLGSFKTMGVRDSLLERVSLVMEEMMMNAIYDAPVDVRGKPLYNHLSRRNEVLLEAMHQPTVHYASDGTTLAVSVTDPFGALRPEILTSYLDKCYSGIDSHDPSKGGAGKGLYQIVETSDFTVFNIKLGVKTEVIAIFNLDPNNKEANPSFHCFIT